MITPTIPPSFANVLFGKSRGTLLALVFGHAEEAFYLRQIARESGFGLGSVQRELKILTGAGILRRTVRGRQVYFQANPESPIYTELKGLILKTAGAGDFLRRALAPIADKIIVAFIYGSIARGEEKQKSDIDLMVVGEAAFSDVVLNTQTAQKVLGRDINPTVYPVSEFRSKIKENQHFILSVLAEPKIFLIGGEIELKRLAAKRTARRA
jgi:predicted nucleotidyltransferase